MMLWAYNTERQKVKKHNQRALIEGQPATLTLDEWIRTLDFFYWRCAYCGGAYQVLEHIDAVEFTGTTEVNCIPACNSCNSMKRNKPFWYVDWPSYSKGRLNDWLHIQWDQPSMTEEEIAEYIQGYWEVHLKRPMPGSITVDAVQYALPI